MVACCMPSRVLLAASWSLSLAFCRGRVETMFYPICLRHNIPILKIKSCIIPTRKYANGESFTSSFTKYKKI